MNNKTVVIFGGAGYVGSTLVKPLLDKGYFVRVMDNGQRNSCDSLLCFSEHPNFQFQPGNINSEKDVDKAFENMDICIHLAACVGMNISKNFTEYSHLVNVEGTKNILKYRPKHTKLFFSSTGSCYGALKEICSETSPCLPLSPYGIQKKKAEYLIMDSGNSCSFRFATAYGPSRNFRCDLLINDLVNKAIKDRTITIFQADFDRTFIYLTDMCDSIIYAIEHWDKFNNQIFNSGDESNNWSKRRLAEYLKEKTQCSVFYADTGWKDLDARNYIVSYEKLRKTGFKCQISMETGINCTIKAVEMIGFGNSRYQDKLL